MTKAAKIADQAPSAEVPAVLLRYQQAWVGDDAEIKVCEKSRRIGLSWSEAADAALYAATASGDDVFYIGYNKDMAQEFIDDCAFWAEHYALAVDGRDDEIWEDEDKDKHIRVFWISFASGHKVKALSSRPSNLRGKQGRIVIDEAAFHPELDELLKAAIAHTMWGGKVRVVSTHNGEDNAFNELINDIRSGKLPYSIHRITLDDALKDGLFQRICLKRNLVWTHEAENEWRAALIKKYGDHADEELFCVPSKGSGLYFPRVLVESIMDEAVPVIRWGVKTEFAQAPAYIREGECEDFCRFSLDPILETLNPNWPSFMGSDFGRSGDLSVNWPLQEAPGLNYKTPFVLEIRNVPFEQQRQIWFHIGDRLPRFRGAALDARGNGQYLAEVAMQRYGAYRIQQVMLSQAWYSENMPTYKAAFEDKKFNAPRDADILDDHRAVRMEKGVAKVPETYNGKGRDGGQRHGDSAIAGAMAWYAVRTAPGAEYAYEAVNAETAAELPRQTHVTAGFRRQEGCL